MLGVLEEVGQESSEVAVVTSSQEKIHEVHLASDEHFARQLQAFENILIGTPDNEFHGTDTVGRGLCIKRHK
jgi:hypothetical protein